MQELLVETIRIDGGTQSRETIDKQYVADLAEVIKGGTRLPPIEVYGDGTDVWCADGYHRVQAHLAAGKPTIRCNVHKGSREDAIWASCAANQEHGLRRTNADKRRAVEMALKMRPELSDRAIAEHAGVHVDTVRAVRPQVYGNHTPVTRIGKDGKTYRVPPPPTGRPGSPPPPQGDTPQDDDEKDNAPPAGAKPEGNRRSGGELVDEVNKPIPVHLRGLFDRATEVQALLTQLSNVKMVLKRAEASEDVLFGDVNFNSVFAALETAYDGIKATTPYAVCPWCQGQLSDQCRGCGHRGVLGKYRYENTVPEALK